MSKLHSNSQVDNFDLVIFGGDGDLALRKIFPALYYRMEAGQISSYSNIFVFSRRKRTVAEFKANLSQKITEYVPEINTEILKNLLKICHYVLGDALSSAHYSQLKRKLNSTKNDIRVFYYSTPSSIFGNISENLHSNGLIHEQSRVVLEKPLGHDLESSEKINKKTLEHFTEKQIYRIDHYLGKETVQNLMVLRFANNLFESSWNSKYIENIQITVAENIGVGSRGNYYDRYGALLDMVQNHLLQLLCLVAMEPPVSLNADHVRDEKLKVLHSLRVHEKQTIESNVITGQYARGEIDGGPVKSYLEDIDKFDSTTETFVAIKAHVDNWRWAGVPFYLRTGKRLPHRYSEIVINFKNVPHNLFPSKEGMLNNKLIIRLQPEEHLELVQMVKVPGPGGYRYKPISFELDYSGSFENRFPEAYERLLMDVVRGNQTLFMRGDEVNAAWKWTKSITQNWEKINQGKVLYKSGTWGPGDKILDEGHQWHSYKKGNQYVKKVVRIKE